MASPPRSPTAPRSSPTRTAPPGFLVPPKPRNTPIARMTVRELRDARARNARMLAEPTASTSAYARRVAAEQAQIESRLVELVGIDEIQNQLEGTRLSDPDAQMNVDVASPPLPQYKAISAKQRALAKFASHASHQNGPSSGLSFQEAIQIEQEAHMADLKRQEELAEKRRRQGYIDDGEQLTRAEREARMWAFMNHKPTDSDLEDDDYDEDDDDPATWFVDDQDDGRKGQDIVEPDVDDYSSIIRIDESRIPWSIPREE
ncbi:uncharacterized protein B0H18DRAFT_18869 [Fomitopsis serialis]|uniref:uncharacterized protein n=1 Tax=Fomitopsis serialis TaxID=139415 RepID=UPI002008D452|nr:uncharacterized protein B0H18DRAFT_18869 [Neoantrodia serialis]KAH9938546.1 hypothetical protein B0H18DRAFT_18869 [Neoantrodia serialis]